MSLFYSPSTGGFYDDAIHVAGLIPGDVTAVTAARHRELLEAQDSEAPVAIVPNGDNSGTPVMSRSRTLTDAERRTELKAAAKIELQARINAVADPLQQIEDVRFGGTDADDRFALIDELRQRAGNIEADIEAASGSTLSAYDVKYSSRWDEVI